MDSPISFSDDYALVFQQRIRAFRENLDLESKSEARGEDRISQLPDAVLRHILSFLPSTKCVVRTSILSTRWKHIWDYVPNLYFDDEEFFSSADFVAFVDRVLQVRDLSAIQKFHLHFNYCQTEDFSRIDGWIRTAVSCNVVELDLSVDSDGEEMFELPISLLTCKTLKVLSLMSMIIINVPTSGCFPSLKFLHLHFTVNFGDVRVDLFGVPVLEHLSVCGDLEDNLLDFKISAPELKTLRIDMYSSDDLHWLYNFSIDAPKLEKLDLKEGSLSNFSLKNTKSLVEADIKLYLDRNEHYVGEDSVNRATEFLAGISMVKYLSLSWGIHEACTVPAFDNLSKLTLFHDGSHWWKYLMKLLERSPNLECLVIDDGFYPPRRQLEAEMIELPEKKGKVFDLTEREAGMLIDLIEYLDLLNWIPPESVPNCLLSHLKTISIKGFKGKAYIIYLDEMELTKYLLKNGRVLEKMTIYTPGRWRGTKEDIYNEISMFEWGSKTVQVELIEKLFYRC